MSDALATAVNPFAHDPSRVRRILDAALPEFASAGVAGAQLSRIARAAGVSRAELHHEFPDKSALFREMVRDALVASPAPIMMEEDGRDAAERLRHVIAHLWDVMRQPVLVTLFRITLGELVRFPELALLHCATIEARALHLLEGEIARGVRRGEFAPLDARAAARALSASVLLQAFWASYPDLFVSITGRDIDSGCRRTTDLFLRALVARAS